MTGKIVALGVVLFVCGSVFTESLIDSGYAGRTPDGGAADLLIAIVLLWGVCRADRKRPNGDRP